MHRIVLFGVQGSGKSTHGMLLSKKLHIPHISTGHLIRRELAEQTLFGQRIAKTINAGRMISDNDVEELLFIALKQARATGWVLDGYPRRRSQAESLLRLDRPTNLIELVLPEHLTIRRLSHRRSCPKGHTYHLIDAPPQSEDICDIDHLPLRQRLDDLPDAIRQRVEQYNVETVPALQWLKLNGIVHAAIDANQPISHISEDIEWQLHFQ